MTMPRVAAATLKRRATPAAFQRAVALAHYFDPEAALDAGFFDEIVDPRDALSRALELAELYKQLDPHAHKVSKRRMRRSLVWRLRYSRPLDLFDAGMIGLRRLSSKKK